MDRLMGGTRRAGSVRRAALGDGGAAAPHRRRLGKDSASSIRGNVHASSKMTLQLNSEGNCTVKRVGGPQLRHPGTQAVEGPAPRREGLCSNACTVLAYYGVAHAMRNLRQRRCGNAGIEPVAPCGCRWLCRPGAARQAVACPSIGSMTHSVPVQGCLEMSGAPCGAQCRLHSRGGSRTLWRRGAAIRCGEQVVQSGLPASLLRLPRLLFRCERRPQPARQPADGASTAQAALQPPPGGTAAAWCA